VSQNQSQGLSESLRQLLLNAIDMVHVRLELIETEIELEKRRLFDGALLAALAMVFLSVGILIMCGLIIVLFFENNKVAASLSLSGLFLVLAALLIAKSRMSLKNSDGVFLNSKNELRNDQASLKSIKSGNSLQGVDARE
jgi:uncharacterized membrane protein YqjE